MRIFLIGIICVLASNVSWAEGKGEVKNYVVEDIVVTSTRSPLPLKSAPVITRVIHAAEIEKSGVPTLQNLLERELAGVEFHQAGYGSSMSFQGLDARYVLFLIDGERIAGETYGNVDYSRIQLNNIDRIEIVRGASSVLYGSNAMGAVVNIITRMPKERVEIGGSFRYGTRYQNNSDEPLPSSTSDKDLDKYRSKLDLPNTKSDLSLGLNLGKFKSLTSFSYRTTDAYKVVGTGKETRHYKANGMSIFDINTSGQGNPMKFNRVVDHDTTILTSPDSRGLSVSGSTDLNVQQRLDYVINEQFRLQVTGGFFSKNRYDFNESIMDESPMPNSKKIWGSEFLQGYNIKALMEHSPNENNKIYLSFVRDEYQRSVDTLNRSRQKKQRHVYNNPRLLWTLNTKYNRLTTGLEMVNEQLNFDLNPMGYDNLKSLNSGSLYVQDEILIGHPLSFVIGLRGDYADRFGWSVTPKVSAKYDIGNFSIRANYSNGYRTPSLKEMYMDFTVPIPGSPTVILGNSKLVPETNNYYSLSGEYTIARFNISATVYRSNFKNKIDVLSRQQDRKTLLEYNNVKRSNINGLELTTRVRAMDRLIVSANYNYVRQENDAPEGSTQYIYPSPHTATAQIEYSVKVNDFVAGIVASVRYVGAKEYSDFMPVMSIVKKPMGPPAINLMMGSYTAHHDGYATANAAINVEWQRKVTLTLGIDNIFDYQSEVVNFNSAILPMRNGFIQLSFKL